MSGLFYKSYISLNQLCYICIDSPVVQSVFLLHPALVPVEETRANKGGATWCGLQKCRRLQNKG